jgi:sarcosine/dimethylglycine N-methyltransferase
MNTLDTDQEAAIYRRNYDTALSELLSVIWGGHLHMGVFDSEADSLFDAQMRANRILANAACIKPEKSVLEVACGIGGTARYLAREYGAQVTATNIAETQIVEAKNITEAEGLIASISYEYADYHRLPFGDAVFDVWWCQEALLYSVDKPRVFEEALRVTKYGGYIVVSDLMLGRSADLAAREAFATAIRAPGLWSSEQWQSLMRTLPASVVLQQDWSVHVPDTFARVLEKLIDVRDHFTAKIGADIVSGTIDRVTRQLDAARIGQLGCISFVLRR